MCAVQREVTSIPSVSTHIATCINLMCDVVYQPEVTKRDKTDIQAKSHQITP